MKNDDLRQSPCADMANEKVVRRFKEIESERILDIEKYDILPIGTDEVFVLIANSNTHYISNYGRCISVMEHVNILKHNIKEGKIAYKIFIWKDDERVNKLVHVDILVADTFLEYEKRNGKLHIWHAGNDVEDNYYRNLYPMNTKEYGEVKKYYEDGGYDSEENIMKILNSNKAYYIPTVFGVGCWGMPNVDVHHWTYRKWVNMLARCYSKKYQERQPNYIGCTVCEEWLCYANFKKWLEENTYECDGETLEIDKDILVKGNKVYSKETCVIVPNTINALFIWSNKKGDYPTGVTKVGDKFKARVRETVDGKQKSIGTYETVEEAFAEYKKVKEKLIRDTAESYKGRIPEKLYEAMMSWEVEYDD